MFLTGSALAAYWLTTFVVMVTPGVTVSSLLGTTLGLGMRAGFAMEAGVNLARLSMLVILGLGLSAVSSFMSEAYVPIKFLGAAYLVWLGIKAIRHPPNLSDLGAAAPGFWSLFVRGIAVLWSNPKAFVFIGALVPQFIATDQPLVPQLLILGAIWLGTATLTNSIYILLSGQARTLLNERTGKALGWISGTVLIAAALWLATSQKA